MKYLLLSTLIPGILCAAASSSNGSPSRKNIHSKSTGEIPSLGAVGEISKALDIPTKGHTRNRSKSELELQSNNPWASPPSNAASPTSWTAPNPIRPTLQKQPSLGFAATHRPHRLTQTETMIIKEKKWRQLRKNQFGPSHKRTNSLPSPEKIRELNHLMELSEQYGDMKQMLWKSACIHHDAMRAQKEFKDEAGKAGALLSLMETSNFEELLKQNTRLSSNLKTEAAEREKLRKEILTQHLELVSEVNQLVGHITKLTARFDLLAGQHACSGEPTSPRGSVDSARSSADNNRRQRSNGSFLGSFGFGSSSKD